MDIGGTARSWARRFSGVLLPDALFLPGLPRAAPEEIRVTTLPLDEAARLAVKRARRPILALLSPDLCLRRMVLLPKAVGAKADAAIALQLRQTLPGQAQGLIWRAEPVGRKGAQVEYEVCILRHAQVDALLAELRELGAVASAVKLEGKTVAPLWQQAPVAVKAMANWMAFSALCVAGIAFATAIFIELKRQDLADLVATRSERVAALEERVLTRKAEAEKGREGAAGALSDLTLFSAQARRLQVLTDLTEVLPDAVWISELSISGDQLVLSGFAVGEVTEVISLLQAQPWASEVKLNGAIAYDSYSGQNRFDLGLTLVVDDPA
ncbi:MAG: PilN domain-containing protein [Tabrizicola sp.]|jgi:hypothetical protein|nr:PilN domain-containing protein [Tabrizicola sp.]